MIICVTCKKEMRCICTGRTAVWNGSHCYAGDEYTCDSCKAVALKCNSNCYHRDDALQILGDKALNMDSSKKERETYDDKTRLEEST